MEEVGWKKDEKPYLVFTCSKCKQYLYVKTTQKTKKCLRCGRNHKVALLLNSGEIVKGMTVAVKIVQKQQNELAIKELGSDPELRADDDFTVKSRPKKVFNVDNNNEDGDFSSQFIELLHEISRSYSIFPYYVFEIMAENFGIPTYELNFLVQDFQKKGVLQCEDDSYKIKF